MLKGDIKIRNYFYILFVSRSAYEKGGILEGNLIIYDNYTFVSHVWPEGLYTI